MQDPVFAQDAQFLKSEIFSFILTSEIQPKSDCGYFIRAGVPNAKT